MDNAIYLSSGAALLLGTIAIAWLYWSRSNRANDRRSEATSRIRESRLESLVEAPAPERPIRSEQDRSDESTDALPATATHESTVAAEIAAIGQAAFGDAPPVASPAPERPADEGRDAVTGLPNRAKFLDELKTRLATLRLQPEPHVLAMVRIDGFGEVLGEYGLRASETVLARSAERLFAALRQGDMVARFDRDTFVLSLAHLQESEAAAVVERFRKSVCQVYELEGERRLTVSASSSYVGVDPSSEAPQLVASCRGALALTKRGESLAVS